jgi:hypothetical protein
MGSHTPGSSWSTGSGGGISTDFDGLDSLDLALVSLNASTEFYPDYPSYVPEKGDRDVHAGGYGGSFLNNTAPVVDMLGTGQISSWYGGTAGDPDPHEQNGSGNPNPTSSNGLAGLNTITRIKYVDNALGGAGGGGGGYGWNGGKTFVHVNGVEQGRSIGSGAPELISGGSAGAAFAVNDAGHLDAEYSNVAAINKSSFGRIEGSLTDLSGNIINIRIGS